MILLTDTCSILLLIRIVPTMFTDPAFGCYTTQAVKDELVRTTRFKEKYPWRGEYIQYVKPILEGHLIHHPKYSFYGDIVHNSARTAFRKNGKRFQLSREDISVVIATFLLPALTELDEPSIISTIDGPLAEFGEDQMEIPNWKPLRIVNWWLDKKLIKWDDDKQSIIKEWTAQEYYRPSKNDISEFERLTHYSFPNF